MGKEEGQVAGHHSHNLSVILMLVYFFVVSFFLFLFVCSFSSSYPFKGTTLIWMGIPYYATCLCLRMFVQCRSINVPVEINFKTHCSSSRTTPLSYMAIKNYSATMRWFNA